MTIGLDGESLFSLFKTNFAESYNFANVLTDLKPYLDAGFGREAADVLAHTDAKIMAAGHAMATMIDANNVKLLTDIKNLHD